VRTRNLQDLLYRDDGVAIPILGYPHRLSRTHATARKAPPRLGQDTRRVLKQLLGLGEPELDALELNGTIADSPPPRVSTG
jgi:glutaryl-CoA transferase